VLDSKQNPTKEKTDMRWDKNVVRNVIFLCSMMMYDVHVVLVN